MNWEYRECEVSLETKPERQLMNWLQTGWELVGLHRKQRRQKSVVVAILRRELDQQQQLQVQVQIA